MQLEQLLEGVAVVDGRGDRRVDVTSVVHDSRQVTPGALFCCLPGAISDGHDFAAAAVSNGAVAVLCERALPVDAAQVVVRDARAAMAPVAAAFWEHPSRRLPVVGVTGTNGKTTTVALLEAIGRSAGRRWAVIGTLTGARTTPEATDLQRQLASFVADGFDGVAMEVSSHALELHRVDATTFSVAVFTNLGRDHLDFHRDEEAYFRAKARLFDDERSRVAVINTDDPAGRRLLESARIPTRPFGMADAAGLTVGSTESRFTWQGRPVHLHMGGAFNVVNALAAATAARELGVEIEPIVAGLSSAPPVPGRFEPVEAGQPFTVIVDYAHTPDGLEQLLAAARESSPSSRLILVFGCGGDRDRSKRPLMGRIASEHADVAILTNDNPRSEDPAAIIADVIADIDDPANVTVEPDRRAAISRGLGAARPGDVVLIAGKGHEQVQEIGDSSFPFDDRAVARDLLTASSR